MKRIVILLITLLPVISVQTCFGQDNGHNDGSIRLIIRGDDIGSFHAANVGCMKSYKDGIMQSVEIMVPCPWYPEAVSMLNKNPGLDVGVHLVMTSEWENMKWRPLTGASSITDERGYFYPMVWPNDEFPPSRAFRASNWKLEDVEKELRAQIDLAKRDIHSLSHITTHMGFASADPAIDSLVDALAKEYGLDIKLEDYDVQRFRYERKRGDSAEERVDAFIEAVKQLVPGTYLYVEHPAMDTREMESIGHKGYKKVGRDRQMVTDVFTHPRLKKALMENNIRLISYADLLE